MAETAKYYIKAMDECDPWDIYYSEEEAENDKLYISDRYPWQTEYRADIDINTSNLKDLVKAIEDALQDIDDTYYVVDDNDEVDEEEVAKNIISTIKYYVSGADKLSKSQLNKLIDLCYDFQDEDKDNKILDIFLEILEILYGEPYISGTFHGYSQSDWALYICPKSLEKGLDFIEACVMGTGTEFAIPEEPLDSPDELETADCYYEYTALWKDDDIKKWAADNIGCSPNDIEIIK